MPGDPGVRIDATAVRVACGPHGCAFSSRRGLVARIDDVLDYAAPVLYGAAAWLAACRLTFLLRYVKPTDDPHREHDWPC